jgi:DegV family protein with EDD domain
MDAELKTAFVTGYERMAAWSDLLDDINLYPVPDADTGRNLRISMAPLKRPDHQNITQQLLLSATGNSGNIAGAFFAKFVSLETPNQLGKAAKAGKEAAWQSLLDPQPGTMLSVLDALSAALDSHAEEMPSTAVPQVMENLKTAVLSTAEILPELKQANVVDAGALGMFIFFEGFLKRLFHQTNSFCSPKELFGSRIELSQVVNTAQEEAYCIDTVLQPLSNLEETTRKIADLGENVITMSDGDQMKIHLHAPDGEAAKQQIAAMGTMVRWNMEKIEPRNANYNPAPLPDGKVHIVTDAAGSLTRSSARALNVTLLESYVVFEDRSIPETLVPRDQLYAALRNGNKVTTAQASNFERHQYYESLVNRYHKVVYLCVGSMYTGNFGVARQWAATHPAGQAMTVIDTTAASGRLGLIAHHIAQFAASGKQLKDVIQQTEAVVSSCEEIIFLDQLKYLAAGGRISKAKGFFGDLFHVKPVISPTAQGAEKIGAVKNKEDQIAFALKHLGAHLHPEAPVKIMLQYTDNQDWVLSQAKSQIESLLPLSTTIIQPMSLTSGVHMGPGTWGVAFLPQPDTISGTETP